MTHEKETPSDRLALVESLLNSTHVALRKLERGPTAKDTGDAVQRFRNGQVYAYRMVLDAFATMGFDIGEGVE